MIQSMKRSALAFAVILVTGTALSAAGQAAAGAKTASRTATMSPSSVAATSTLECTGADGKSSMYGGTGQGHCDGTCDRKTDAQAVPG